MNFIFISPQFPENYQYFCQALKKNQVNVLGIGDMPYDELSPLLKESLTEYYRVSDLENYDEVLRAVGFFTFKYGKIDWIESNNEYWLEQDARLRTDFHVTTGFQEEEMEFVKRKSKMKECYKKAGVLVAPYHLVTTLEEGKKFIKQVGYPVIIKPDNGVGANDTRKIGGEEMLCAFYKEQEKRKENYYIMEPFVDGEICSYDAIINQEGEPLLETGNITPISIMDMVNEQGDVYFYIVPQLANDIKEAGRNCVRAFGVKGRFVHFEFFRLKRDQEGIGRKGQIIGLEVNMRPSGGYTPDMINFSLDTDVYQCWADMIAFHGLKTGQSENHYYSVYVGRRFKKEYLHNDKDIWGKYDANIKMERELPEVIAHGMGDYMCIARFQTKKEMEEFVQFVLEKPISKKGKRSEKKEKLKGGKKSRQMNKTEEAT
ncbi:MAG: ATP-grasp domain-containing protein [Clostridiales bacterium]|nr:ATP-grasp domain-containing protein [Clostridiales bacterium]